MTNLWSRTPETAPKNPLFPNLESESFPSFNFFFFHFDLFSSFSSVSASTTLGYLNIRLLYPF